MEQIARSATQQEWGYVYSGRRWRRSDCPSSQESNLNAFAERWVRTEKEECLSKLILFGEGPLSRTLAEFSAHDHGERNHQGKGNQLLFPSRGLKFDSPVLTCRHRLGGLLKYYSRAA